MITQENINLLSSKARIGSFPYELEDEAVYIIREVAAQFEKPVLLFSGGKDSITLVRLAQKAFYPAKFLFHSSTSTQAIIFLKRLNLEIG